MSVTSSACDHSAFIEAGSPRTNADCAATRSGTNLFHASFPQGGSETVGRASATVIGDKAAHARHASTTPRMLSLT